MTHLTIQNMTKLWPHSTPGLIQGCVDTSATVFPKYGLNTSENIYEFMATVSEETGGGISLVESGNYSAARAHAVWPSLFPTVSAAVPYVGDGGFKLFNYVYGFHLGKELGNIQFSDGWNFRGRGLIQITGRSWYTKISKEIGVDLVANPSWVVSPKYALECACAFWKIDGINSISGNFSEVTRKVNGGYTNMTERENWLKICHVVLNDSFIASPSLWSKIKTLFS